MGPLAKVATKYRRFKQLNAQISEAMEIAGGGDPEMRQLAESELPHLKEEREKLWDELLDLIIGGEDANRSRCVMEIRAGTGGDEAALFARDLYGMYRHYAEGRGWKVEILSMNSTELGGFKEIDLGIDGEGVYQQLQYESGGHRVQRVPETEAKGRIHTSAATVAVLPEPEDVEIELKPDDYRVDRFTVQRPGRTARQQDRLGHPPDPLRLGHRRQLPGREEPAQEPGQGPPRPQEPALRRQIERGASQAGHASARARSAPATAASGSAPTIFPRTGSPTTASTSPSISSIT